MLLCPQKTLGTILLNLEKSIFICSSIYHFLLFFFAINNEQMFFKEFVFDFTIPFTLSEIMKALVLVEHLSMSGF